MEGTMITIRKKSSVILAAALLGSLALTPAMATDRHALPTCAELGSDPAHGLAGNPQISGLTTKLIPEGTVLNDGFLGPTVVTVPVCQVDFTFSGESGPQAGYLPGQREQIWIRVQLPASNADGGSGGVQGAWNGKNRDTGGGGYQGVKVGFPTPTASTNLGYVGTLTDTGHDKPGGSFALNPDGTLNWGLIRDFARDGIHAQHVWGVKLAKKYYGREPTRKYWMGCSTGGRQGHYQAQNFPQDYDGILAGAPAFNWDRFVPNTLWPAIVINQEVGAPIAQAKINAVSAAAIAACDTIDGIADGIIQEPRKCKYDARSYICNAPNSPANCLTPAEAAAVNKIWDGPVVQRGVLSDKSKGSGRAWYGIERGTPFSGEFPTAAHALDHYKYWLYQDPNFDARSSVTEESFFQDMLTSIRKFNDVIGTDDRLDAFRKEGGKMITYHGFFDPLIIARGTYHYYNSIAQGNYKQTQNFYRFFPYPNAGHCVGGSGPEIDQENLFSALVNWVERGVAPDHFVATQNLAGGATRTRKICKYPDVQVYLGSGSTDDHNNFACQVRNKDDKDLLEADELDRRFETSMKPQGLSLKDRDDDDDDGDRRKNGRGHHDRDD